MRGAPGPRARGAPTSHQAGLSSAAAVGPQQAHPGGCGGEGASPEVLGGPCNGRRGAAQLSPQGSQDSRPGARGGSGFLLPCKEGETLSLTWVDSGCPLTASGTGRRPGRGSRARRCLGSSGSHHVAGLRPAHRLRSIYGSFLFSLRAQQSPSGKFQPGSAVPTKGEAWGLGLSRHV